MASDSSAVNAQPDRCNTRRDRIGKDRQFINGQMVKRSNGEKEDSKKCCPLIPYTYNFPICSLKTLYLCIVKLKMTRE